MKNNIGLYIHFPFCEQKCKYCDFCSFSGLYDYQEIYIEQLIKEIKDWSNQVKNDVLIKTISEGKVLLEHRTIGGIIDYYIYYGNKVDDVLIKMHDIIGHPMLPPFWSLGYHQCRWGYFNTSQIEEVMKKFHDYEIPLDTLWGDVDILQDKRIFSIHKKKSTRI